MALKIMNGLDLQSQLIQNVASPSATTDAANKAYVDGLVQGLSWKTAVRAATTAAGTLASSFANGSTIDGVTLVTGNRILIKNQAAGAENGIYTVNASGAPTRATDMDVAAEFPNATVYVSEGTTNADTGWTVTTNAPVTVGTTSITWAQIGTGGTTYSAGNGLSLASTTFSVLADPVAGGGVSVTASGVKVDTAVVVRKYAASIGNGALTSIAVTHNLGTQDITWSLRDVSGNAFAWTDGVATDANTLTLTFAVAPTTNQYRVVVHG
jgi:hypothetical protein